MRERISIDATVQHGKPVIRGTRVPVVRLIGGLAGGMTIEQVADEYGVTEVDVRAALTYASEFGRTRRTPLFALLDSRCALSY